MGSQDPYLSALKKLGLSVVRLPRANLGPLTVMVRDGSKLLVTGTVPELMKSAVPTPQIRRDQPAAGIAANKTRELDVSLGLNLLAGWLGAMGAGNLGIETQFKNAKTITFAFPDVQVDTTSGIELDKYLARSEPDPTAKQHVKLLESDRVYVIVLAAKSRRFSVEAKAASGQSVSLDVPAIQQLVGGEVKVSAAQSGATTVSYEGKAPLYFGFQALQLFYKRGQYQGFESAAEDSVAILGDNDAEQLKRRVWLDWNAPFTAVEDISGAAT